MNERTEPEQVADSTFSVLSGSFCAIPEPPTAAPEGYLLLEEIGRGGMGVVHRARDLALGREVAIKILANRYPAKSNLASRFSDEARITGHLQHPGIPAVHQFGTLPDGRPFLAMRLINGRTLDELLTARRDPSEDHGRFLAIFEAVAQAVGYAHAHGVIHRDLKPQNIMVGAFGEVQVMDWGLAKVMEEPERAMPEALEAPIRSTRGLDEMTQTGSVLGTPAYMPPEQATGAVDRIDVRSDVFGLGAILCVILSGRPPYQAADGESTRELAARTKLDEVFSRLGEIGAEPALVALCKRCLSAERADRPANAGEVAVAVARLRAAAEDRARTAELDRRAASVQEAADRRRRRIVTIAAGIVAAALAVGAGLSLWQAERAENQAAKAIQQKERADTQYRQARLTLLRMLESFGSQGAGSIPQVIELQRVQSEQALAFFESVGAGQDDPEPNQRADLAAACKEAARLQIALGRTEPAERNLRRAIRLLEELNVEASDDPEPRGVLAASFDLLGLLLRRDLPAHGEEAASCGRRAVALSERLVRDFPAEAHRKFNLAQACDNLGTLHRVQRGGSTVELYERSLNLLRELHRASPERVQFAVSLAETCSNLGSLHWGNNRLEKADELFKEGLAILEPLVAANPNHSWYGSSLAALRINLGSLLLTRGRTDEALQQYDRALAALQAILRREPEHAQARGDLLPAHGGRAQTLSQLGRHVDAVKDWDRVVELAPAENRQGYRLQRAAVLIQAGEFARAAAEADDVAGAPKADAADMFEAGRLHARIATETPSRAEQHASNAVAWLRKAKATGFFKTQAELGNLQQADFSELKKRAEFQTLLREATDALGKK